MYYRFLQAKLANTTYYWYLHCTNAIVDVLWFVEINWGSSTQAHVYRNALQNTQKLIRISEHVKNFRSVLLLVAAIILNFSLRLPDGRIEAMYSPAYRKRRLKEGK